MKRTLELKFDHVELPVKKARHDGKPHPPTSMPTHIRKQNHKPKAFWMNPVARYRPLPRPLWALAEDFLFTCIAQMHIASGVLAINKTGFLPHEPSPNKQPVMSVTHVLDCHSHATPVSLPHAKQNKSGRYKPYSRPLSSARHRCHGRKDNSLASASASTSSATMTMTAHPLVTVTHALSCHSHATPVALPHAKQNKSGRYKPYSRPLSSARQRCHGRKDNSLASASASTSSATMTMTAHPLVTVTHVLGCHSHATPVALPHAKQNKSGRYKPYSRPLSSARQRCHGRKDNSLASASASTSSATMTMTAHPLVTVTHVLGCHSHATPVALPHAKQNKSGRYKPYPRPLSSALSQRCHGRKDNSLASASASTSSATMTMPANQLVTAKPLSAGISNNASPTFPATLIKCFDPKVMARMAATARVKGRIKYRKVGLTGARNTSVQARHHHRMWAHFWGLSGSGRAQKIRQRHSMDTMEDNGIEEEEIEMPTATNTPLLASAQLPSLTAITPTQLQGITLPIAGAQGLPMPGLVNPATMPLTQASVQSGGMQGLVSIVQVSQPVTSSVALSNVTGPTLPAQPTVTAVVNTMAPTHTLLAVGNSSNSGGSNGVSATVGPSGPVVPNKASTNTPQVTTSLSLTNQAVTLLPAKTVTVPSVAPGVGAGGASLSPASQSSALASTTQTTSTTTHQPSKKPPTQGLGGGASASASGASLSPASQSSTLPSAAQTTSATHQSSETLLTQSLSVGWGLGGSAGASSGGTSPSPATQSSTPPSAAQTTSATHQHSETLLTQSLSVGWGLGGSAGASYGGTSPSPATQSSTPPSAAQTTSATTHQPSETVLTRSLSVGWGLGGSVSTAATSASSGPSTGNIPNIASLSTPMSAQVLPSTARPVLGPKASSSNTTPSTPGPSGTLSEEELAKMTVLERRTFLMMNKNADLERKKKEREEAHARKQKKIEKKLERGKKVVEEAKDLRAESEMAELHYKCAAERERREAKKAHLERERKKKEKNDNKENMA